MENGERQVGFVVDRVCGGLFFNYLADRFDGVELNLVMKMNGC